MSISMFSAYKLGDLNLSNRMVMAPLTRNRAGEGNAPTNMNVEYYKQRASAGLIITEASQISPAGVGYPATPGIYSNDQVAGWRKVVDSVHQEGGKIFIQLWFCGRISHPSMLEGKTPVAPSALRPEGDAITYEGMQAFVKPRALEMNQISDIVKDYKYAASQAKAAGFDGIEVHGANGYLIDQFLRNGSNHRDDIYGGSVENRMRFLNEVLDAVCDVWPANRVGLRLSAENSFNSMSDSDPLTHFSYFITELNNRNLAYLHMLEGDMMTQQRQLDYVALRKLYSGQYIANNGYNCETGKQALADEAADLIAYGVPFLSNPDLVSRFKHNSELNQVDQNTFYGGDEHGYTDYPFMNESTVKSSTSSNNDVETA